jgi:Ca2+-binding RTX toxin-like protein
VDTNFGAPMCPLDPSQPLRIEGSNGNDRLSIFSNDVPDAKPIQMHGNGGNDEVEDVFLSGAGRVLTGGAGTDIIEGHGGNDSIDGGPGTDTTEEWGIPSDLTNQPRATVSLDGVANDGRPGEGDNVVGIERIRVSVVGDYVGSDGADEIKVINPGNEGPSSLTGLGGNDILVAEDFDDAVDGGAGNDTVRGGRGNDTVTGGSGRDTIYGDATSSHCSWYSCKIPFGNDVIQARDGEVDNIDCGIGTDTAVVDPIDVVANCETVDGSGGGGGGGGGGGAVTFSVTGKASLRALASKGLKLAVPCPSACNVSGSLKADRKTARKVGASKIGSGRGSAQAAGTATLKLKPASKVKRRLKRLRKATVTVRVTVKAGGAAQTDSQTLTLRR